jgi:hypothetical protein
MDLPKIVNNKMKTRVLGMSKVTKVKYFKCFQIHLILGWAVALACLYHGIFYHSLKNNLNFVYNNFDAAIYCAFASMSWSLFLAWIIYVYHTGNGGKLFSVCL